MALKIRNIAIFASGAGSNAKKLMEYFAGSATTRIALVVCNKPGAGVLQHARQHSIETLMIERERFFEGDGYTELLHQHKINFIVLAGFLWKVPDVLLQAFATRHIVNIHPALLPKYGGKGMYGQRVHQAVIDAGEEKSGITIHYVDGHYDNGDIIFQATCTVESSDTAETLAEKVHGLEHRYYAQVVEDCLAQL